MHYNLIKQLQETDLFPPPTPDELQKRDVEMVQARLERALLLANSLKSPMGIGFFNGIAEQLNSELTDATVEVDKINRREVNVLLSFRPEVDFVVPFGTDPVKESKLVEEKDMFPAPSKKELLKRQEVEQVKRLARLQKLEGELKGGVGEAAIMAFVGDIGAMLSGYSISVLTEEGKTLTRADKLNDPGKIKLLLYLEPIDKGV